jgi:OmcA/MtrC family decaheme c-type cytochrome
MPDGTRAILALQGKPQLLVPTGMSKEHWDFTTMYVRVPTPVYEFVAGTGAAATPRRAIADTKACLKCHVGSLYQHGNTRVDNVTMCIICHNEASSDQNNRVTMGVDASEAYDGLVGQTYGFKSMLHMLHIAGEGPSAFYAGSKPLSIYRTRGIYAWAYDDSLLPNWGTTAACEKTTPTAGQEYRVFGSDPALDVGCQPHNFYSPTYPRAANECEACHVSSFKMIPDQSKAVATTLDAGKAPWGGAAGQLDDVLQGPAAAACTSCHQSSSAKGHAYQNGWTPTTFPNGRQTILDAAK